MWRFCLNNRFINSIKPVFRQTRARTPSVVLPLFLRQSVQSRFADYDDTNDAESFALYPAMRHVVGGRGVERSAASTSVMNRFETEIMTQSKKYGIPDELTRFACRPGSKGQPA